MEIGSTPEQFVRAGVTVAKYIGERLLTGGWAVFSEAVLKSDAAPIDHNIVRGEE